MAYFIAIALACLFFGTLVIIVMLYMDYAKHTHGSDGSVTTPNAPVSDVNGGDEPTLAQIEASATDVPGK